MMNTGVLAWEIQIPGNPILHLPLLQYSNSSVLVYFTG
jgi:hypothetical protein